MRSMHTGVPADMNEPMLCGAICGGLDRVILAAEHRPLAEKEGSICRRCLRLDHRHKRKKN
jgi:hypothetical protein